MIAGFVAASVIMMIVETANGKVIYPELSKQAEGVTDREGQRRSQPVLPSGHRRCSCRVGAGKYGGPDTLPR